MGDNLHHMQAARQHQMQKLAAGGMEPFARMQHVAAMHRYLRAWRDYRGFTLEHVAEALHVSAPTISRWEGGQVSPKLDQFKALARLYGVDPLDLLFCPEDRPAAERLRLAHQLLEQMPADKADAWLQMGRVLLPTREREDASGG